MQQNIYSIRFRGAFAMLLSLFFMAFGCTSATTGTPENATPMPEASAAEKQLLQADEALHMKLQAILDADNQYNQVVTGTATATALDESNGGIIQAEIALQQTIDSLNQQRAPMAEAAKAKLTQLTGYFKAMLESRRLFSDMRMILSADSDDSATLHQTLVQLRNDLQQKNKRIAALERATNSSKPAPESVAAGDDTYAPARGESLADLRQRNKNLSLALSTMQTKYFVMGRDYLVLKKQYERTANELAALRKSGNPK